MVKFDDLVFDPSIHKAIKNMKYEESTEVQEKVIPLMIEGKNVICKSHTGSGKTLAFGIPAIHRILANRSKGVLILGPTRELVVQVKEELYQLNKYTGLRSYCVYGGHGMMEEIKNLRKGVDILSATPGRLLDHFQRRTIKDKFDTVVLDEADRILDMGFLEDIKRILRHVRPENVHLFSATVDGKVARLIQEYIPEYEQVIIPNEIVGKNIIEKNIDVTKKTKFDKLVEIVQEANNSRVLVFTSTKRFVDLLCDKLVKLNFKADGIHGDKSQKAREIALSKFKKGTKNILVATDVAARGLQIDNVEYVVNYDPARDKDTHKHRIGRTGRMGNTGQAISFISDEPVQQRGRRPQSRSSSRPSRFSNNRSSERSWNRPPNQFSSRPSGGRSSNRSSDREDRGDRSSFSDRPSRGPRRDSDRGDNSRSFDRGSSRGPSRSPGKFSDRGDRSSSNRNFKGPRSNDGDSGRSFDRGPSRGPRRDSRDEAPRNEPFYKDRNKKPGFKPRPSESSDEKPRTKIFRGSKTPKVRGFRNNQKLNRKTMNKKISRAKVRRSSSSKQ
jgi:ATP-dependent RNA helicase DeaD